MHICIQREKGEQLHLGCMGAPAYFRLGVQAGCARGLASARSPYTVRVAIVSVATVSVAIVSVSIVRGTIVGMAVRSVGLHRPGRRWRPSLVVTPSSVAAPGTRIYMVGGSSRYIHRQWYEYDPYTHTRAHTHMLHMHSVATVSVATGRVAIVSIPV